jgi:DNA-binding MarR family transcriptional regulator
MHLVSGNEYKVLAFLLSRSFGQGQEAVALTLPDFYGEGKEGIGKTGLSRASVIRCITALVARGFISRTKGRLRDGFLYRVEVKALLDRVEK